MKTYNYLIVAFAALALVGCSDNDFLGTGSGPEGARQGNGEITFNAGSGKITRGEEITGKDAADKLGGKFTVYGWKTNTNASGKSDGSLEDVYKDYLVTWGANTAYTTESNTANWEYVGNTSQPIDGAGVDQTIKYWDYSTSRYDFIAWTINPLENGSASVLKNRATVSSTVAPSLTFNAPTASALGSVYISDKYTATPTGAVPAGEVLTNATSGKHTLGKYSGSNNNNDDAVRLQFRSLAAKVRIGLYETVPGYQVSDVVFYKENATKNANYTYTGENPDYVSDQTYATLFATSPTFTNSGDLTVYYHDKTYMSEDTKLDNTAYTDLTPGTQSTYFAFGQLTNTKGTGTKTVIDDGEAIGTTSNTATMSIGNDENTLYTYVFPMETNTNPLNLKVNYTLTSIDGSGETIHVTGANAVVPANFAQWMANYAYTYLFKISDNTNGSTNPSTGPEGLYPITFDAVVVDAQEGYQETITTVNDNSITTYQDGSEVTVNDEYLTGKDIYVAIKGLPDLTADGNLKLYICEDKDAKETLSEEVAANYMNNGMIFTNVSALLTVNAAAIEVPNSSGAGHGINFAANKVAKFAPVANTIYVVEYDAGGGVRSYKIIKVENGTATQTYTLTMASGQSKATNEAATFTITNGDYNVTGAKSLVVVKNSANEAVTDDFVIAETSEGNYTVTPKTAGAGTYKVSFNGVDAANTFAVTAPVWNDGTSDVTKVYVEEGKSIDVNLLNKSGGDAIEGVTPTVPAGLKATKTIASGETTITAVSGESGEKTVSYNGSNLTVEVDKFTLTPSRTIINVGDADHRTATLTLTNANATGTAPGTQSITSTNASAVAGGALTSGSMTITALAAGTTTLQASGTKAKANIEVVNYEITDNGNGTITLTKDGAAISGQVFSTTGGVTVTATSTTGVYKVTGTGTISFKYKGVVVADVTI